MSASRTFSKRSLTNLAGVHPDLMTRLETLITGETK
jgi:hypothetical protein